MFLRTRHCFDLVPLSCVGPYCLGAFCLNFAMCLRPHRHRLGAYITTIRCVLVLVIRPNPTMEATAVHTPIEIHDIVPSVFVALRLISDAHDIGWFLVLVSDVALSFTRYVCGENDIRLTEELSTRSGYAVECLRDFETMSTTHGHVLVNVEELFDLVRIVYTSYLLTTPATRSTWRAINDPTEYAHLLDTQTTIVRLLSVAVVDDMFDRGYDVNDISIVDNIWGEGTL